MYIHTQSMIISDWIKEVYIIYVCIVSSSLEHMSIILKIGSIVRKIDSIIN